ncbi:hypothetical protein [Sphingomonas alpina]|uniref:Uncharacterized protein n=1 Tax=Sphingomonas alpina TaxID=653931 RepID=A0A7H0LPD7_9SPHN|nr:hypothetical protein [Sphingomonas alpina]QNQ11540.1 hypothetical protein H3Z74_10615 [Sphingomonas alpina]
MTMKISQRVRQASAVIAIAASLALAGCNPKAATEESKVASQLPELPATLPLASGGATVVRSAAAAAALPAAKPIRVVQLADPGQSYAYADDARGFADAIGDAPPDYGFDYDDVEPWAWQGYDDSIAFAEPIDDGYRYYYYRPGAVSPYFVRDHDYGYGYDNGQLAVVYAASGAILPYAAYGPRQDYAARYYARGRDLYRSSHQRRPVIAANWAARQNAISATQARWAAARSREADWQRYHASVVQRQQRHWGQEQVRRRADTVRYDAWRDQRFSTRPPPRAIPAAWTLAPWARDANRYAPAARGFAGDQGERQRAAAVERRRVAMLATRPVDDRSEVQRAMIERRRALAEQQSQLRLRERDNAEGQRIQAAQRAEAARRQGERARQIAAGEVAQRDRQARAVAMQRRYIAIDRDQSARVAQQTRRAQARNDEQARAVQARQRQQAQSQARAAQLQQRRQGQVAAQRTEVEQRRRGQARAVEAQERRQALAQTRAVQIQQRQQGQAQQRQAQIQQRAAQAQQRQAGQAQQRQAQAQRQQAQGQARAAQAQRQQVQAQARAAQTQARAATRPLSAAPSAGPPRPDRGPGGRGRDPR